MSGLLSLMSVTISQSLNKQPLVYWPNAYEDWARCLKTVLHMYVYQNVFVDYTDIDYVKKRNIFFENNQVLEWRHSLVVDKHLSEWLRDLCEQWWKEWPMGQVNRAQYHILDILYITPNPGQNYQNKQGFNIQIIMQSSNDKHVQ